MSTGDFLNVDPVELKFPFELKKQISCSLQLSNKTDYHVAFKVKTTNPKKYCVRPNTGIVLPNSTCEVIVTMQAQKEFPADMQCKDKFLLQGVKAPDGAIPKDITAEMFNREAGNVVEECKLRVVYVFSSQHTPARDGSEVGSSMRGSVSDNGQANTAEFVNAARTFTDDVQDKSPEAKALITKLTEEKNKAIQQNNKLRQELELLKLETSRSGGGLSFMIVMLIGLIGLITGYIMKRS
ncbi:Vesicle-associated protein 1-1 [Hibiscus syriacus]|uniref:Vesicle-associated protein 1-1 n=1 Tax=Hibiscus syriacus TaxID=106335 RepID=A0A6A3C662_HIBSY|nr:vesicle-associated protein 1-2-like [Hibiscus syriacus]KAE8722529.1 Vesicle-associated protein 1-1 [Hibiscus syriacus]